MSAQQTEVDRTRYEINGGVAIEWLGDLSPGHCFVQEGPDLPPPLGEIALAQGCRQRRVDLRGPNELRQSPSERPVHYFKDAGEELGETSAEGAFAGGLRAFG